jgi:urease accessory protein UreF
MRKAGAGTMSINSEAGLYRLMSWLSPSFPVGAYSYSHGIEYAFEAGDVTNQKVYESGLKEFLNLAQAVWMRFYFAADGKPLLITMIV